VRAVAAVGGLAAEPPIPDLVSDLGAYVGAFGGLGAAAGWTSANIARGLGRDVDVGKLSGYGAGAGAFAGIVAYIAFRLGA
jgi:hypothetical protein